MRANLPFCRVGQVGPGIVRGCLAVCALASALTLLTVCSGAQNASSPQVVKGIVDRNGRPIGQLPPGVGVTPGQAAPLTRAFDTAGVQVAFQSLYDKGPVLLVFYRGGWCPFCQTQIHSLWAARQELAQRGVQTVVVAVDPVTERQKPTLPMASPIVVLHDPDMVAHTAFSVVHVADEAEVKALEDRGISVDGALPADRRFAIPAVFLIQNGVVTWAHAEPEYRTPPPFDDLRPVLEQAGLAAR